MSLIYRQKPVQVEAWCNDEDSRSKAKPGFVKMAAVNTESDVLEIRTSVGIFNLQRNDYLVKFASGEVRPYKPDTFASLFEKEEQAIQQNEDGPPEREVNEQPLSGEGSQAALTGEAGQGIQEGNDHTGEGETLENPAETTASVPDPTPYPDDAAPDSEPELNDEELEKATAPDQPTS